MRVGVLTGGGDCPGLNAVIRAVVRKGEGIYGHQIVGFRHGWRGVLEGEVVELTLASTRGLIHRGGTILGTSRTNPLKMENGLARVRATLERERIDALIVIGGEDTLGVAAAGAAEGLAVIGVPKTIDNDLSATDVTFGFQTAVQIATDAIDRSAYDGGEPRPRDGGGSDGTERGVDRHVLGHRRRRRHRPRPRTAFRHRCGV